MNRDVPRETLRRDEPVLATQRERPTEQERCQYGFLALLSHDVRNRLAPMRSAVEVLQLQSEQLDDRLRRATEALARELRRWQRLLDELLDVSQLMGSEVHVEKLTLRIDQAVGRAVETLGPVLAMNGATAWLSVSSACSCLGGRRSWAVSADRGESGALRRH
nr:hypothetical protein [Gammaproteobacteria bacterium]